MANEEHPPRKFKFEIHTLEDVVEHLDALWDVHNKHCEITVSSTGCIDPPSCCGEGKKGHRDYSAEKKD
jgi:hypothetical protein